MLKENYHQSSILYPAKISFNYEDKVILKQKLKCLVTNIPKGNNKGHSSGRRIIALPGSSKIQKEMKSNKKGKCQPNIMKPLYNNLFWGLKYIHNLKK